MTVNPTAPAWTLPGAWEVSFADDAGERVPWPHLISWTTHTNPAIRYYSGTATYTLTFELPAAFATLDTRRQRIGLDLGRVEVMAEVSLNGHSLGTLWKPPFRVDLGDHLQPGRNRLQVKVTNPWRNRLVGAKQTGVATGRPAPALQVDVGIKADDELLPAGLLGPVRLAPVPRVRMIP